MESLIKEKVKKKKKKNKKKRRRRRKLGDLEAWVEGLFIIFYSSYWVFSSAQVTCFLLVGVVFFPCLCKFCS